MSKFVDEYLDPSLLSSQCFKPFVLFQSTWYIRTEIWAINAHLGTNASRLSSSYLPIPNLYSVPCSRGIYVFWRWTLVPFNMSWQIRRYTKNHGKYDIISQTCSETVFSQQRATSTNVSDVLLHLYFLGNIFKDFYLSSSTRVTSWKKGGWV